VGGSRSRQTLRDYRRELLERRAHLTAIEAELRGVAERMRGLAAQIRGTADGKGLLPSDLLRGVPTSAELVALAGRMLAEQRKIDELTAAIAAEGKRGANAEE